MAALAPPGQGIYTLRVSSLLRIAEAPGLVLVRGPVQDNTPHRHYALQLTVALEGDARLDGHPPAANAVIAPDQRHRLSAPDALTLLLEPHPRSAVELRARLLGEAAVAVGVDIDLPAVARWVRDLDRVPEPAEDLDPRIADALRWMSELSDGGSMGEVSLAAALERAHLSESRFLHLFRQHTGVTWRRAVMWRRALAATRLASEGRSLTEAAHRAGYADSAHFSRQFRDLFGFAPSAVGTNSRFVQADALLDLHSPL